MRCMLKKNLTPQRGNFIMQINSKVNCVSYC